MNPKTAPLTRRKFSRACLAAGAAPLVLPGRVRARPSANDRITVGMLGVGRQAYHANMPAFLHMPDVQVVAVCDVDDWRLQNARKRVETHYAEQRPSGGYRGCAVYRDFREMLARPDIDAVMISTQDHWHVPMSLAAIEAGKDVSLEKPITVSIREGRLLCDAVARYSRVFRTDSEFRSRDRFRRACELVLNGRIGTLRRIRTGAPASDRACPPQPAQPVPEELDYDLWLGPAPRTPYTEKRVHPRKGYGRPGWMRVRDYCDGMISNWGTHLNDIAQWGNGTQTTGPVEIEGTGTYPDDGLWDVLTGFEVTYRYANGVEMLYTYSHPHVRFEGTEGWVQADLGGRGLTASSPAILNAPIGAGDIHLPAKTDKRDFIDAVKTRGATMETAEIGHRTTTVCHLGHIAIQVGRRLRWDPDAEVFPDDPEANRMLDRPRRAPWVI
ncbi:Gfo/Idh/MocA family protein [Kiritimatiella glycovorans]|uniref:1,5-anhydro-D-fructose reductase n=1 Tax=Kiritimatiella glycovorans TaxID=1307763 RepID=A0A0G3EK28_9BACT|nr:Gfo/Idh/MocA family oxidoreductase [Kiritimatiella glycovorans]AKJ65150.1 1,5-anhydro-D-fructose reductase [Kiritimatiella glycovorans]